MKKMLNFFLVFLALPLVSSIALAESPVSAEHIFEPVSDTHIEARDGRLIVSRHQKVILNFSTIAALRWSKIKAQLSRGQNATFQQSFSVLSHIGPWLGLEETAFCDCGGAHSSEIKTLKTYDLADGKNNKITELNMASLFSDKQIIDGFLKNDVVKKIIGSDQMPPESLKDMVSDLAFQPIIIGDCSFEFDKDMLSNFIIKKIEGDYAIVNVGLSAADEVCRGMSNIIELRIAFPQGKTLSMASTIGKAGNNIQNPALKSDDLAEKLITYTFKAK